ncbi:MAG: aminotransferase class V-fold PLP-dependent enzyme [Alphaproteobacteria bacterium]|nr:aminotransferase class V-fold PLP-dependent enzyme [Alphaproteobacteria bacterium]
MLPCQRAHFDIPEGVSYLAAASQGPLPRSVREAGQNGLATKSAPWRRGPTMGVDLAEAARAAAARLVGAGADDIAIVPAASYGIATAGRNLPLDARARVLVLEGEHSSQHLEWVRLTRARNAMLDIVPRPADGDWTSAVLAAIERPGAPPVAIAALTPLHWSDGAVVDLDAIAPVLRRQGAALVIDATQGAGVLPMDVRRLQPDFMVFPTYKWLLGSYSFAFLYAAPHRQEGQPIEQTGQARAEAPGSIDPPYLAGARRYDMGERDGFTALPMAIEALRLNAEWTPEGIRERCRHLTDLLAERAEALGLATVERRFRAPHVLGLRVPGGATRVFDALTAADVHTNLRQGVLRVAPHVYSDEADVERFAAALARAMAD